MINGFMSMDTITRGLELQQLEQEVIASNLANPSLDPNGYLINSLQRVNVGESAPNIFGNVNGLMAASTGPLPDSITRLRNSFLDTQIQNESSVVGYNEILSNSQGAGILNQINGIVNGTTTLGGALNTFTAAWTALSSNPLNMGLRASVVNAGVAFAQLSNSQYSQLAALQQNNGAQINGTVSEINQILQQLSSINNQLLNSQGASNVNALWDARDYALDRLSRLVNIQTNIGVAGTVSVYLGASTVALIDPAGAAIFQTNVQNPNYPNLLGVTIQSPEGGLYDAFNAKGNLVPENMAQSITGGNLGGELQGQNAILAYQTQVDQIATSVLNVTNNLHEAGYAGDGTTTGIAFFTGTGAQDINVNAALVSNNNLVAASVVPGIPAGTPSLDGTVAQYIGNMQNLLANNFAESQPGIAGAYVDPTQPLSTQTFANPPANGSFTVNGSLVTYTTADSIDSILAKIHAAAPNVDAVYNATTFQFYLLSNNPINLVNLTGNFLGGISNWSNIVNVLTSTIRMNNSNTPIYSQIDYNDLFDPAAQPLNSTVPSTFYTNTGPNSQSFLVVPSPGGSFTLFPPYPNGNLIPWNNTMSLGQIATAISTATANAITVSFNSNTQTLTLLDHTPQPMQISDNIGNFTAFTGLNGNVALGSMASALTNQITSNVTGQQFLTDQASNSLAQLNAAQANIAGVSTGPTTAGGPTPPGVPIATIQQQAMQSLITYNALLEVLRVIDNMYSDLVGIATSSSPSGSFDNQLAPA